MPDTDPDQWGAYAPTAPADVSATPTPAAAPAAPDPWGAYSPASVAPPPTVPDQPSTLMDVVRGLPSAAMRGLTSGAATLGEAASLEESNPEQAEQMPTPEQAEQIVEQYVTGPLYKSQTPTGRAVSTGVEAITSNPPAALMGPSIPRALVQTALSSVGSEEAGAAARAIAPESQALETGAELVGGVLTPMAPEAALTGVRALRAPPKAPDISQQFGVTQTPGEVAGDLGTRQREASAMRDLNDKRAQQFVEQRQQELSEAPENALDQMGLKASAESPAQAADVVSNELTGQQRANDTAVRQQGAAITKQTAGFRDGLSPTGTLHVETPMEAANIVQGAVANEAERWQNAIDAAYDALRRIPGYFHPATFNNIGEVLTRRLRSGPDPTIINPQTTPQANAAVSDLDDVLSGLKQTRDPDTGRVVPRPPITPQVVENARKRLNTFYGDAIQAAQSSGNQADVRAMRRVMGAFDDYVADRLGAGTYIGGDPSGVVDAMGKARAQYAAFRKTFTKQGQGDVVGPVIQKILGRYEGQAATPEEVRGILYGKGGTPVKVAQRLIQMFGADSLEIGAIKQGFVADVMKRPPGLGEYTPEEIADRIEAAASSTLGRTYLSPQEIQQWRQIGTQMRGYHANTNPELDAVDKTFLDITGDANKARAGNQDVRRTLFEDVMRGDRDAEEMLARLQSRLSPEGWATYKKGLFLHASTPIEGVPNWGPSKTADRIAKLLDATRNTKTFTTGERAVIKAYGDFMRGLALPARGYSPSGPEIRRLGSAIAGRIGGVVGAVIGHSLSPFPIMGELAGYTVGRQAEHMAETRLNRISKTLPIAADQWDKYNKAITAYKLNRSQGTKKLAVNALTNFSRSLRTIGSPDNQQRARGGSVKSLADGGDPGDAVPLDWIQIHSNAPTPAPGGTSDIATSNPGVASAGNPADSTPAAQPVAGTPQNLNGTNGLVPPPSKTPINAPGQATGEAAPSPPPDQGRQAPSTADTGDSEPTQAPRSILDKLLGIGGPRYELWPERMVRSALTAPGEALATGQLTQTDPYGRVVGTEPEISAGPTSTDILPEQYGIPGTNIHWAGKPDITPAGFPSETAIQRSQDIAGLQFSGGAGAAEEGALGSGGLRLTQPTGHEIVQAPEGWFAQQTSGPGRFGPFPSRDEAEAWANQNGGIASAPEFYSAVEQAITSAKQNKMTPDQWIGWLKNQPGVKPEELQWAGLGDKTQLPPDLQTGTISRDQLLAHLKQNNPVQLRMVEKGGEPEFDADEAMERVYSIMRQNWEQKYPRADPAMFQEWMWSPEGEAEQARIQDEISPQTGGPRYSDYQLPGGSNYRETLLTLPQSDLPRRQLADQLRQKYGDNFTDYWTPEERTIYERSGSGANSYQSSHWDEPNVLMHLRMNDRDIPSVGRTLHLEELQSDWHQLGRKRGYDDPVARAAATKKLEAAGYPLSNEDALLAMREGAITPADAQAFVRGSVPDAPFKTTWPDLGLKTAIAKAAREGYDAISWTPGEQQAARYDLSKHVDTIRYNPRTGKLRGLKNGEVVIAEGGITPDILADYIGKEAADKVINNPTKKGNPNLYGEDAIGASNTLEGQDLKIGGSGMKGFYDDMLVKKANVLGKRYGAHVEWKDLPSNIEVRQIGNGDWVGSINGKPLGAYGPGIPGGSIPTREEALEFFGQGLAGQKSLKVPVLRLTPKLKEQALKGMPLFARGGAINRKLGGRVNHNPTPAQKDAGNYAKRHTSFAGLNISIENEKGSKRRGVGANGKPWESVLPAAYGYFKKSEGADGDHVDVYIGPHKTSTKVFVIDQVDAKTKKFDEHKVMLGFGSKAQATGVYKKAFSDGKALQRLGHIHEMTLPEFKEWLKHSDTARPIKKLTRDVFQYHLTKGPDRCAVCQYTSGTDNGCGLFRMMNQRMPEDFDLDPDIRPNGWCSGFTKRGGD